MMGWQWHQLNHANHLHLTPDRQPCQHLITPYFLLAGCPSCRPTNGVKALKAGTAHTAQWNLWQVTHKSAATRWCQLLSDRTGIRADCCALPAMHCLHLWDLVWYYCLCPSDLVQYYHWLYIFFGDYCSVYIFFNATVICQGAVRGGPFVTAKVAAFWLVRGPKPTEEEVY